MLALVTGKAPCHPILHRHNTYSKAIISAFILHPSAITSPHG